MAFIIDFSDQRICGGLFGVPCSAWIFHQNFPATGLDFLFAGSDMHLRQSKTRSGQFSLQAHHMKDSSDFRSFLSTSFTYPMGAELVVCRY